MAVKGNQETLERGLLVHIDKHLDNDFADANARPCVTVEKGHGREEVRTYVQMPVPEGLPELEKWKGLKTIGIATLVCDRDGEQTSEVQHFISSLPMGVKCFARAVRSHWGIENSCHWSLDMTFREDESRIRDRHLAENFAWLNRYIVPAEATSKEGQHRHEATLLRLERRLLARSPYRDNWLVAAGPEAPGYSAWQQVADKDGASPGCRFGQWLFRLGVDHLVLFFCLDRFRGRGGSEHPDSDHVCRGVNNAEHRPGGRRSLGAGCRPGRDR